MKNSEPKVLMIGPDRKANGGISTVVNQYFGSNIENVINVKYIATMTTGNF